MRRHRRCRGGSRDRRPLAVFAADHPGAVLRPDAIDGPTHGSWRNRPISGGRGPGEGQVTAALYRRAEPVALSAWARARGLSVRWRHGDDWAFVEGRRGARQGVGVTVRDYRTRGGTDPGRVFYASPQQPDANVPCRDRGVSGLGRILS